MASGYNIEQYGAGAFSLAWNKFKDDSQSPWGCGQSLLFLPFPIYCEFIIGNYPIPLRLPITASGTLVPQLIVSSLDFKHISSWGGNLKHRRAFDKIRYDANQNIRIQAYFCLLNRRLKIVRRYFEDTFKI